MPPRKIAVPESAVQQTIVEGLTALGYHVFTSSRQRKRCRRCGHFSTGGDGVSKGLPDLLVGREGWGPVYLGMEVKGAKTPLSPEQEDLFLRDMIVVVRSWDEAASRIQAYQTAYCLKGPVFK